METVIGFGGVFLRAKDPKALADWYEKHLGVVPGRWSYRLLDHSRRTRRTFQQRSARLASQRGWL